MPSIIFAQNQGTGLGIILGEPTGLCFKNWIGNRTAIDFAVAWSFGKNDSLHLHADYLFHSFNLFKVKKGQLPFYYGIGGRIKAKSESRIGIRIPVGICYIFEKTPLDIFLEIGPVFDLVPNTDFWFTSVVGMRYYF
jgi:hypothetical protein